MSENGLFTVSEAAAYLGIAVGTLRIWCHEHRGGLRYVKLGGTSIRFRKEDLDEFIASSVVDGSLATEEAAAEEAPAEYAEVTDEVAVDQADGASEEAAE